MNIKQLRELAKNHGKRLVFNRTTGGYQIVGGFSASELEYPWRDKRGKPCLNEQQITKLASYI